MKTTGLRSAVLYFVLILLIGPLLYLLVNLFVNGETWIAQAYNGHIYASDATVESGDILDSNNLLLLYEEDGEKLYSDDVTIRTALLHTIGDYSGYIGTSIQSRLKSELVGYNFITGLNTLPSNPYIGGQDISLTVDAELCAKEPFLS
ncbi:MAG: penicillin-binding protein, partial [Clostridia bacterium]